MPVKVIVAPATREPVSVVKVPLNTTTFGRELILLIGVIEDNKIQWSSLVSFISRSRVIIALVGHRARIRTSR